MTAPTVRSPPRPGNNRVLRELTLSLTGLYGAKACVTDASAHLESFYLIYGGDAGITPSRGHRFVEVDLVRSSGAPTLASCYLVEVLHAAYNCSTEKLIVENVHQFIVLAVVAAQEADALLDTSCLLYTSPSPRDQRGSRMPSSA